MNVMIWTGGHAHNTDYATTQQDRSFATVLLGMKLPLMAVGILMNARTTSLAARTRCALTCLEVMNVLVPLAFMRKNRLVLTLMNVRIHLVTSWRTAGTPMDPIHVTALWDLQEMDHGAKMWMSAMHSAIRATIGLAVTTAQDHFYVPVMLAS